MNRSVFVLWLSFSGLFIMACENNANYDSQIVFNKEGESDWKLSSLAIKQYFLGEHSLITEPVFGKKLQDLAIKLPKQKKIQGDYLFELYQSPKYFNFSDLTIKLDKKQTISQLIFDLYLEKKNELPVLAEDLSLFLEKRLGRPTEKDGVLIWEKNNTRILMLNADDHVDSGIRLILVKI